ncbi:MAG: PRD domain-containing protein, partial [Oscillospiraceae bacterium]|nr:PRD domain-containing protein [Oscillospiraceae bacterium]
NQHGRSSAEGGPAPSCIIYGSIAPFVWQATNELIQYASIEFDKTYDQGIISSIAYYLQQLKSYANAGRIIFSPNSFENTSEFPNENAFVVKMMPLLKNYLGIELMDGEIILLAMLLAHSSVSQYRPSVNLLLCGYANSASAIAAFANSMLNTNFIKALDMPDNINPAALRSKIFGALGNNFRDTLILCGFNISAILRRALSKDSLLYFRILPILDPMIALESARMILMTGKEIDEITAKLISDYRDYLDAATNEPHTTIYPAADISADESTDDMRDVIITYCITGVGSARIVREMLLRDLSVASTIDILPLGIKDDIFSISHKLGKRLKLIIGIMNPDISGVPYVSIEQFLYANGSRDLLRSKGISLPLSDDIEVEDLSKMPLDMQLNHIREHLYYFAPSLDVKKVDKGALYIIEKVIQLYQVPLPPDLIVRIYIHCATMFERISTADPIPMPLDGYAAIEHSSNLYQKLKAILNTGAETLDLSVTDAEVYYLMITLPQLTEQAEASR